jgi:hypothetical protein
MTDHIVRRATDQTGAVHDQARCGSWHAALPWLMAAGAYLLLLILGERLLADGDTYWHLAVARWIVDQRSFPTADPFSFTAAGTPWIAFEWLSEMALLAANKAAGWAGVAALTAAAAALALGLLTRFLIRELDTVPALVLAVTAFVLTAPHLLARPHVLVMPVMVAWVAALVRSMDRHSGPPFIALPLIALWANMHGSVSLGIAFIGPAALEALWQAPRSEWPRLVLRWGGFGLLALAAACITPYGPQILLMPLTTFGLGSDALKTIVEWRPQDFSRIDAFQVVLFLALGFALLRGLKLPPVRLLVLLGLLHMALAQSRHADLLALLAPMFLARPLAEQFGWRARAAAVGRWRLPAVAATIAVLASAAAPARDIAPDPRNTPAAAIAAADLAHSGPVFNDYAMGGYLIYAGIPPFIDGRGEIFGRALMLRHARAIHLQDPPDFLRLLDDYRINATLLAPGTPAAALLDLLPQWQRVYTDDNAVVHKRRAPMPRDGNAPMPSRR